MRINKLCTTHSSYYLISRHFPSKFVNLGRDNSLNFDNVSSIFMINVTFVFNSSTDIELPVLICGFDILS
jgi:hypothetical protein